MATVGNRTLDIREPDGKMVPPYLSQSHPLPCNSSLTRPTTGAPSSAATLPSVRSSSPSLPTSLIPFIEATAVETLQNQFSGYGSTSQTVARTLDRLGLKEPLEKWSKESIEAVVNAFITEKFPTVYALNKIDHPDADKNIAKIAKMHPPESIVLCSAISEVFLRRLAKQGFVRYTEGSEFVDTRDDLLEAGDASGGNLKPLDEKLHSRIENLKDMVLYRFGSTGVVQVLSRAAELLGLVPVFPVRNINTFAAGGAGGAGNAVFRDCVLVKKGTTVGEVARKIMGDAPLAYVEGVGGRVAEEELVAVGRNDVGFLEVISFYGDFLLMEVDRFSHSRLEDKSLVRFRIAWIGVRE